MVNGVSAEEAIVMGGLSYAWYGRGMRGERGGERGAHLGGGVW